MAARERQEGGDFLRGQQHADQADRAGRARRHVHLRRSRLDGLRPAEGPDQAGYAFEPARQPARSDRARRIPISARIFSPASTSRRCSRAVALPWATSTRCPPANTARPPSKSSAPGMASRTRSRRRKAFAPRSLLVARGEAPLGIVYQTDAAADPTVKIVGTFPENTHPPIIYPIALTKDSTNPDALAFLNFTPISGCTSRSSSVRALRCSGRAASALDDLSGRHDQG